jgi:hypothetical protein
MMPMISSTPAGRQPDFICLGTQRAGTTWLYRALAATPGYWMPPFKELNAFGPGGPRQNLGQKLLQFHARLEQELASEAPDRALLRWFADLCLAREMDLAWYRRLFAPAGTDCTGDISPIYYVLPPRRLAYIAATLPETKVIVVLREPLERALSQRRFMIEKGLWAADITDDEVLVRLRDKLGSRWSDHAAAVKRIESAFPGRVGVFFYDELQQDPAGFLDRVTAFLGRARPPGPVPDLGRVNPSSTPLAPLSHDTVRELARCYLERLGDLPARFPEPVAGWVARLEAAAESGEVVP